MAKKEKKFKKRPIDEGKAMMKTKKKLPVKKTSVGDVRLALLRKKLAELKKKKEKKCAMQE